MYHKHCTGHRQGRAKIQGECNEVQRGGCCMPVAPCNYQYGKTASSATGVGGAPSCCACADTARKSAACRLRQALGRVSAHGHPFPPKEPSAGPAAAAGATRDAGAAYARPQSAGSEPNLRIAPAPVPQPLLSCASCVRRPCGLCSSECKRGCGSATLRASACACVLPLRWRALMTAEHHGSFTARADSRRASWPANSCVAAAATPLNDKALGSQQKQGLVTVKSDPPRGARRVVDGGEWRSPRGGAAAACRANGPARFEFGPGRTDVWGPPLGRTVQKRMLVQEQLQIASAVLRLSRLYQGA